MSVRTLLCLMWFVCYINVAFIVVGHIPTRSYLLVGALIVAMSFISAAIRARGET